jgi:DNA-binding response OmpR family regulator
MMQEARPDLLLDLNLESHHDGLEVCRILRSDPDPALARTPVIMLTGEIHQAASYVGKPYSPLSLMALIDTHLASWAAATIKQERKNYDLQARLAQPTYQLQDHQPWSGAAQVRHHGRRVGP